MRFSTLLLASLAGSAATAQQFSFQAVKDKLASYIPSGVAHPIDKASSKAASKRVVPITKENWKSTLTPHLTPGKINTPEEWWVFFTGGNSSCYGRCDRAGKAFNETAGLLQASSKGPHFASVDCDSEAVVCTTFGAAVPSLWHFLLPTVVDGPTTIRIKEINHTTVTASELMSMHTTKSWKDIPVYEGYFHPFDGVLAQYGLNVPLGYVLWGFSAIPSWMFMIFVSFLSRNIMSRRAAPNAPRPAAPAAPARST